MKKNALTNSELSLFCYQLSLIFKSGLPLDEAMSVFTDEMSTPTLKKIALSIKESVDNGEPIYEAVKKHDFGGLTNTELLVSQNAYLTAEQTYLRLSTYYQEVERLNQKVSNAVIYPVILTGLMLIIITFLVVKVIPMFSEIIDSIGADIPNTTAVLISIGLALKNYGLLILILLAILCISGYVYTKKSSDAWKYNMPFIGNVTKKIFSEKFALGMSMLMAGGYSFDDALVLYTNSVESKFALEKLKKAQENILEGKDVSDEIANVGLFPALFTKMIGIGYKTGEIENSLKKVASLYKLEVEKTMDKVTSSIEPMLIIILSLLVGVILFTVMTPLISIVSSL